MIPQSRAGGDPAADTDGTRTLWAPTGDDLAAFTRHVLAVCFELPARVENGPPSLGEPGFASGFRIQGVLQGFLEVRSCHLFASWVAEHLGSTVKPVDAFHKFALHYCEKVVKFLKEKNHPDFEYLSESEPLNHVRPRREPDVKSVLTVSDRALEIHLWIKPALRSI